MLTPNSGNADIVMSQFLIVQLRPSSRQPERPVEPAASVPHTSGAERSNLPASFGPIRVRTHAEVAVSCLVLAEKHAQKTVEPRRICRSRSLTAHAATASSTPSRPTTPTVNSRVFHATTSYLGLACRKPGTIATQRGERLPPLSFSEIGRLSRCGDDTQILRTRCNR
jgi:hypothetical protein